MSESNGVVDKSLLLAARNYDTEDVAIAGFGNIRIRPLTRAEVLSHGSAAEKHGLMHAEAMMIATAVVEPKLSVEDVKRWQRISAAGEIEPLTDAIMRVSAMTEEGGREATDRFPEES